MGPCMWNSKQVLVCEAVSGSCVWSRKVGKGEAVSGSLCVEQ